MSDGDQETEDRVTSLTRAYRGDISYVAHTARRWAAERGEKISAADVWHESLALLRAAEREREQ